MVALVLSAFCNIVLTSVCFEVDIYAGTCLLFCV